MAAFNCVDPAGKSLESPRQHKWPPTFEEEQRQCAESMIASGITDRWGAKTRLELPLQVWAGECTTQPENREE